MVLNICDLARAEEGGQRNRKAALEALTAQCTTKAPMTDEEVEGLCLHSLESMRSMLKRGEDTACGTEMLCLLYLCPLALPKINSRVLHLFSDAENSHSSLSFTVSEMFVLSLLTAQNSHK